MSDSEEGDRFSFEDSDRFEEDSLCSWSSEPESLCNHWRGWKRPTLGSGTFGSSKRQAEGKLSKIFFVYFFFTSFLGKSVEPVYFF